MSQLQIVQLLQQKCEQSEPIVTILYAYSEPMIPIPTEIYMSDQIATISSELRIV